MEELWSVVFDYLDGCSGAEPRRSAVRRDICAWLSELAAVYIVDQIRNKPSGLARA